VSPTRVTLTELRAPLSLAIGLPAAGIGLLIALDAIPNTLASALNSTVFLAAVAIVAPSTISEHVPQYAEQ
jgi:Na+/H+-dicarboxylate symporter